MPNHKFQIEVEKTLSNRIVDTEFSTVRSNRDKDADDFENIISLLDSVREPKQYDWMSDVRIPEFLSHILTQASIDANQYFQTRDFVEVYLDDERDESLRNADAAKELVNRTLNQRHIYHYLKYMRAKTLNNISGRVYARCWWDKETKENVTGEEIKYVPLEVDIEGRPIEDIETQIPALREERVERIETVPVVDRFNYDIIDSRNIFTDNKYSYSLQDKDYVFVRSETSKDELLANEDKMSYFNLEAISELSPPAETDTSKETYNNPELLDRDVQVSAPVIEHFDLLERYGKFWCIVTERDEDGFPKEVEPGIDEFGVIKDGAELIETIITHVLKEAHHVLIRFQATPFRDMNGKTYRPLIQGLCYVHPTNDEGIGDGKHVRELQLALDDTFNISNDRVMLATVPTLKVKNYQAEDNPEIYIEPGHVIPLDNPREDLEELRIEDNMQGALQQMQFLKGMMQQLTAIYPTTMGDIPGLASTTATAIAGGEQRTNMRSNYKALTFENTFLADLYWMIQQMTWAFAHPETGEKLMGDKVFDFDPSKEYFYTPVSASIEPEYSKQNKVKLWIQVFGYMVNIPHPDIVNPLNYIMTQIFKYMGDEFVNFGDKLLNPQKPMLEAGGAGAPEQIGTSASNQAGLPQSVIEETTRGGV